MNVVIIEDEKDAIELLTSIITDHLPGLKIMGTAGRKKSSIEQLTRKDIDIAFLDIQLYDCKVFEVLKEVDTSHLKLIFTTAFDQYAIKAFEYFAVGYVLKPYEPQELKEVVKRVIERDKVTTEDQELLQQIGSHYTDQVLKFSTHEGIERINADDIIRVKADRAYSQIFLKSTRKLVISKPLAYVESLTDSSKFIRPHMSHLVNRNAIVRYSKKDGGCFEMIDGSTVPVSRRKKKEVLRLL